MPRRKIPMLARLFPSARNKSNPDESVRDRAGRLFASGLNCSQAVLQAAAGVEDPELMAMAKAFGGGIGGSKCLCGAISGGVMALGLKGNGGMSGELVELFKERHRVTCCSALSRPYKWKSGEHLANCRKLTEDTAEMVEKLLGL
jgi:C_GCAxxG_C_C family probable redox protein